MFGFIRTRIEKGPRRNGRSVGAVARLRRRLHRLYPSVPKPQKIIDLALSPTDILDCERRGEPVRKWPVLNSRVVQGGETARDHAVVASRAYFGGTSSLSIQPRASDLKGSVCTCAS